MQISSKDMGFLDSGAFGVFGMTRAFGASKNLARIFASRFSRVILPIIALLTLSINEAIANRYDYLLFSNNYTDVRKGVDLGADVNARLRGSTPLYDASRKNNMDILYLLLRRGADVNALSHGESALHKVVQFNNLKFAQILLKEGADPNIKDSIRGNTALHYAVSARNSAMITLLMNNGADMHAENNNGDTPARYILANVNVPGMTIQNRDIRVTSSAFRVGTGSVSLNVTNLTNTFITITYGALYMDGDLVSEQEFSKKIPPKASATVGAIPVTRDSYENVSIKKSGVASIKYGFAIEYDVDGSGESLYKTTKTEIKVW
ncbi:MULTISPECIES: ankyrin repeat domain-containing protein [unclassified Helicobacter]|uniref:ankyrin repeat domain-containing protein n=1 Tax=unclassified Helicobacter TaxID=2593540 RepID=UPI000AE2AD0E|nr:MULTISPECIES: ankyrin repeat domain-containing protein [unclassified Helicobacter]